MRGVAKVARYLASTVSRSVDGVAASIEEVNSMPAVLGWFGSTLIGVLAPQTADGRVTGIRIMANPDKLRFLGDQLSRSRPVPGSYGMTATILVTGGTGRLGRELVPRLLDAGQTCAC